MISIEMQVSLENVSIPITVSNSVETLEMDVDAVHYMISGEPYDGSYEVTPRLYAQSLDTDGKLMEDDVTVFEIPISRTTNPTGGLTVLIG